MATIIEKNEGPRGCGKRKGGGTYLVSDGEMIPCGKLPLELSVCPCCSAGIKASRGWTWVDPQQLFKGVECNSKIDYLGGANCSCPLGVLSLPDTAGLLWIGEKFYSSPDKFSDEAIKMGISRRISRIPQKFVLGETLVLIAHRKVKINGEEKPAIFSAFRPTAIEYVITGDETEDELNALEKRGFTLVKVNHIAPHRADLKTLNEESRRGKNRRLKTIAKFINDTMCELGYSAVLNKRDAGEPLDADVNSDGSIPGLIVSKNGEVVYIFEAAPGAKNSCVEEWLENMILELENVQELTRICERPF